MTGVRRYSSEELALLPRPGIKHHAGLYKTIDGAARFSIELPQPLAKDWYRLSLRFGDDQPREPVVRFVGTSQDNDDREAPLFPAPDKSHCAYVYVLGGYAQIELHPHGLPDQFEIDTFSIEALNETPRKSLDLLPLPQALRSLLGGRFTADAVNEPLPRDPGYFSYFDPEIGQLVSFRTSYWSWLAGHDYNPGRKAQILQKLQRLSPTPRISILASVIGTDTGQFDRLLAALHQQLYQHWELCVASDNQAVGPLTEQLKKAALKDQRIKIVPVDPSADCAARRNRAFASATGAYILLLAPESSLREHALAEIALAGAEQDAQIIYGDEDMLDADRRRHSPRFYSDWSPDLFRTGHYFSHMCAVKKDAIDAIGGWREGFEKAADYDLLLRLSERAPQAAFHHIHKILTHRIALPFSDNEENGLDRDSIPALEQHLQRTGVKAKVEIAGNHYQITPHLPDPPPLVSLIIPTRDQADILRTCLSSILDKTTYPNFEILLVDNQSADAKALRYLREIAEHKRVRVLSYPHPFNYSAINNFAVAQAQGTLVGLINNDVEVIAPNWLDLMAAHALRPDIGCVGAKLYFPNGRIQHAGITLGLGGVAGHGHKNMRRTSRGYLDQLVRTRNVSAVTAACLLVRKSVYQQVDGLDEHNLPVAFNDVDFCLRLREAGYLHLFEPRAELCHHESLSRGPRDTAEKKRHFKAENTYMHKRWGDVLPSNTLDSNCGYLTNTS